MKPLRYLALCLLPLSVWACSDPLDPYEEVQGLRVLAISADSPQLTPGASATVSALVTEEGASYQWSWCPFALPASQGAGCAISHEEFQMVANMILPSPAVVPDYDLGTGETAAFTHSLPPMFYKAVCDFVLSQNIPDGFDAPDCSQKFEIQVGLTVTKGGESIVSVSSLELLYDDVVPANTNPVLLGLSAKQSDGTLVELDAMAPTQLVKGSLVELSIEVNEDSSESYQKVEPSGEVVPAEENLIATWFYDGGSMDKSRSSYVPGSVEFEVLTKNEWDPLEVDEATLYVVLRDGRGGTSFLKRSIELVAP